MPGIPVGQVGLTVVANVERLRKARRLSLRALSDRLAGLGRPILPIGLSRLSQGKRRVDADDLVALAAAALDDAAPAADPPLVPADARLRVRTC